MSSDVSTVSSETSIMASLSGILPSTAFHALLASAFAFGALLYLLRRTALSTATENLQDTMCRTEWIYYGLVEGGILDVEDKGISRDIAELRTRASALREQSLRASLSVSGGISAYCFGLSFRIMRCTKDVNVLKTRIEIASEAGLRGICTTQDGQAHALWAARLYRNITETRCTCKL
ncbi:hypothetical protein B0H15DRAFT_406945 [Mycena belliarum]|uniref:Uncharacterized protein n=1 Tax=Mycena belliarum TaxID=1033014 RepID=A0AAD6UJG8_9AGAR|nr:hypothetical protein B0H15DRAFT_406945 [Mycena belliae]